MPTRIVLDDHDEAVALADLRALTEVYAEILRRV